MLNQVVLVGRIVAMDLCSNDDKLNSSLVLSVTRPYQENDGQYTSDEFNIILWRGIAETISDNYQIGSVIGVKGRLQRNVTGLDVVVVAEKISFISENIH